jgi:hypothetical protein
MCDLLSWNSDSRNIFLRRLDVNRPLSESSNAIHDYFRLLGPDEELRVLIVGVTASVINYWYD